MCIYIYVYTYIYIYIYIERDHIYIYIYMYIHMQRPDHGQCSKSRCGEMGPAPGRFGLSKGHV